MRLIFATNNAGKLRELREILPDMDIVSQREAGLDIDVDETGTTFAENARLKAEAVTALTGEAAVADDSGLCVDALNGEPGVYSARYSGSHDHTDAQRNEYLLKKLENTTDRRAKFVCAVCCTMPNGDVITAEGSCPGEILRVPTGSNGFGYDPLFRPDGYDCSMAELTQEEKNAISHRGNAVREFRRLLERYLAEENTLC